jgi:DNA polymerase-3 subunit gamma/tau
MIEDHLRHILETEQIQFEPQALSLLAKAAEGSMRDALSLMDQAIAYSAGNLRSDDSAEMLGTISNEHLYQFLDGLAEKNAALIINTVTELAEKAPDFSSVLAELIELWQQLALVQMVPEALDRTEDEQARLEALASQFHKEDLQLFYQIAMQGRRDMPVAPDPRSALEMVLLRMLAFAPILEGEEPQVLISSSGPVINSDIAETKPRKPAPTKAHAEAEPEAAATVAPSGDLSELNDWVSLVPKLEIVGMTKELANNCMFQSQDGPNIVLGISRAKENMVTGNAKGKLESALAKYLGMTISLQITPTDEEGVTPAANQQAIEENRQKSAEQSIMEDDFIREMQEAFDAEPVPGTVKPTK